MKTIKFTNPNLFGENQSVIVEGKVYNRIPYAKEYTKYITINGKSYV
tara:strand:+ start:41 stop:181 length:141 start_codon:yes stop_codon:yes gene_type:complete